jgi:NADPH:quinone reductase-like Zn-dependent oxidoreductase
MMRAVRLHAPGGPAGLALERLAVPQPGAGEVLLRVHAAAITRDELDWPVDRLPATPSYEVSGVVAAVAEGVDDVAVGDEVYALTPFDRDGAAADYAIVPARVLASKPRTLRHVEASAIPLAGLSAWQALFDQGELTAGQRVLIHSVGGVGGFAVQLAHRHGAEVIATVSTRNVELARALGADQVVDHNTTRFEDAVNSVDLVFDTAGGDGLERSFAVVRRGGRIVSVATEPSQETAQASGVTAIYFIVELNRDQLTHLAELADSGDLRPTIDKVFALEDARAAFERSLSGQARGKIVFSVVAQ